MRHMRREVLRLVVLGPTPLAMAVATGTFGMRVVTRMTRKAMKVAVLPALLTCSDTLGR